MKTKRYTIFFSCLLNAGLGIISCKKDKILPGGADPVMSPTTGSRMQFTLDSIYLYAKQTYFWNDVLPDYQTFDPRSRYASYGLPLQAYQAELFDIAQRKINPTSQLPFEKAIASGMAKYSFLEDRVKNTSGTTATSSGIASGNPVIFCGKFGTGGTRVGYIALSNFPTLAAAKADIDASFASLTTDQIPTLIVDLRSNGGGYVETAEYIANKIIPAQFNGKVMYTEQFNSRMQSGNATILQFQPYLDDSGKPAIYKGRQATMADVDYSEGANTYLFYKKDGFQNIKNVYFIVGGATASASELLINCLKPYLQVKLVGSKTFGKPVGFMGINIDTYTVFMSNFLIKNALGNADYFDGMPVDIPVIPDNSHTLGDPDESCLKATLQYIGTGKITSSSAYTATTIQQLPSIVRSAPAMNIEEGMIENRLKLKDTP